MANTIPLFFISYVSLIFLVVCISEPNSSSNSTGFSVDLFHRYSVESPYYDPSLSPTQIMVDAIRRSVNRSQWLNESKSTGSGSIETDIVPSIHTGTYFMKYEIGSRGISSLGLIDTGSNLIWTQCFPCAYCFNQSKPHYEPHASSTYKKVFCHEKECTRPDTLYKTVCETNICYYIQDYADTTTNSRGTLSRESFTLASAGGTTNRFPSFVFGCSFISNSNAFRGFESGIIGLGRGPLSLVSQLGRSARGKFSYCMVPLSEKKKSTRLIFGEDSEVVGGFGEVVHTPLFVNKTNPSFYCVKLMGFSVGGSRYYYYPDEENFAIDSGATLTRFPNDLYAYLKRRVKYTMKHLHTKTDPDKTLDLCFRTKLKKPWVPKLTFHFEGDKADVTFFDDDSMFYKPDVETLCMLIIPAGKDIPSLGFIAQANFMVGYDTEKKRMSFKPTRCANQAH